MNSEDFIIDYRLEAWWEEVSPGAKMWALRNKLTGNLGVNDNALEIYPTAAKAQEAIDDSYHEPLLWEPFAIELNAHGTLDTISGSKRAIAGGNPEFLRWMADRLVNVYKEDPNVDYVHTLRTIAKEMEDLTNG
jgi:hypothetical protein